MIRHLSYKLFIALALILIPMVSVRAKVVLTAQNDNALRVQLVSETATAQPELVFVADMGHTKCKKQETETMIKLSTSCFTAIFDKSDKTLTVTDSKGHQVLKSLPMTTSGDFTWTSPEDEFLAGTGQFQDGYLNVRGLSRRLTQVNTQISVPFLLSNKGYALLWHNYGITEWNPSRDMAHMQKSQDAGESVMVNVTSTTGNKQERRDVNAFYTTIEIAQEGNYSFLLDVGQKMARKQYVAIDGQVVVDYNNLWLPPTTSFITHLTQGRHQVEFRGDRNDQPTLGWRKVTNTNTLSSPQTPTTDFTVFVGNADECIASYRRLTGGTPLMPHWALGYIHCRERYNTQHELLDNAAEFRRRGIPIDMIVQDWQYWGKHGWNAMRFDEDRYPDAKAMVDSLHKMDIRLMLSVWSKIDRNADLGREAAARGYYIPGTDWIDFFNPEAARFYWDNYSKRLLPIGIDAWWQDATEPENDDLLGRRVGGGSMAGEDYRNVYPMLVNKTVYEGLRRDRTDVRAMILTRSAFAGQQRYGTATWSGDVGNDWGTLRRQIIGGLGMMASGQPWWTYDAGGFFRPGNQYNDADYQERLLRWVEASVFLPLMRVHGYMSQTEPWRYSAETQRIFTENIRLRYRLLPYIYSEAARVTFDGGTLMRPLVMDYPHDARAMEQTTEFMFGQSMLIAPVTEPKATSLKVYLPSGCQWYDFWTHRLYTGGQTVEMPVTIDRIPVFVKAGSIIPMADSSDRYGRVTTFQVYPGADCTCMFYEDNGTDYAYEQGEYSRTPLKWNDGKGRLTWGKSVGHYAGRTNLSKVSVKVISQNK